jgi:hypothetical protein
MELIDGIGSKRVRYLLWGEPGRGLKGRRPESEAPGGGEETGDGKRPGGGEETEDGKQPGMASGRGWEETGDCKRPGILGADGDYGVANRSVSCAAPL